MTRRAGGPSDDRSDASVEAVPVATIEELTPMRETLGHGRVDRRMGLAIALALTIVGIGLVSRLTVAQSTIGATIARAPIDRSTERPTPQAALFELTGPADGGSVVGGVVEVAGVARVPLGKVHLSVVLGDAVLGWSNIVVSEAGPVRVAIPVFGPPFDASVQVRISIPSTGADPLTEYTRAFHLRDGRPVGIWRAVLGQSPAGQVVSVDGYARASLRRLTLRVKTSDGRTLGTALATVDYDDGRPGSVGGRLVGLASFHAAVVLRGADPGDGLVLEVVTKDPANAMRVAVVSHYDDRTEGDAWPEPSQ